MNRQVSQHFHNVLKHLYINPLEKCNLNCKMCYTRKTSSILKGEEILDFISRYQKVHLLESITFCGGEVFTLPYFPKLINILTGNYIDGKRMGDASQPGLFIQIITNGTVDRLAEFENPNMVNLIVSLDGLPEYHDQNRGKGNFAKSLHFLKKAMKMGFHTEIFSIVTRQNFSQIGEFEGYINQLVISTEQNIGKDPSTLPIQSGSLRMTPIRIGVTYHPRKPLAYLEKHPVSNIYNNVEGFDFLPDEEITKLMEKKKTFPPKELGCYQIALMSDGKVYGCCEGTIPIGSIGDDIGKLIDNLKKRLEACSYCPYPDFMCGLRGILNKQISK